MHIRTALTLRNLAEDMLSGATAVVIDALRMTTTAITAIQHGAAGILPVETVEEARRVAARFPDALLCGEREGVKQDGFHLGNSPLEFTEQAIRGRRLICTTTNGTRAILAAEKAEVVLLASFCNARAIAKLAATMRGMTLICAGTHDALSLEDVLAAGAVIARLNEQGMIDDMDDASKVAYRLYQGTGGDLFGALADTRHTGFLLMLDRINQGDDVRYCLKEDTCDVVPVVHDGWITRDA